MFHETTIKQAKDKAMTTWLGNGWRQLGYVMVGILVCINCSGKESMQWDYFSSRCGLNECGDDGRKAGSPVP